MNKQSFIVWIQGYGETADDGYEVIASDPSEAAIQYANRYERLFEEHGDDFDLLPVHVLADDGYEYICDVSVIIARQFYVTSERRCLSEDA